MIEPDPDIIIVTESWCNQSITCAQLNIDGYFIDPSLRCDRIDTLNGIGGGIIVYLRNGLRVLPCDNKSDFIQYSQFKLVSNTGIDNDMTFTVIYRSPNSSEVNNQKLCDLIGNLSGKANVVIGDFNYPNIDWSNNTGSNKDQDFLNVVNDKFLTQMITFPTHKLGNTLDLLFVNDTNTVTNIDDIGNLGKSDHSSILIELSVSDFRQTSDEPFPDWKSANFEEFNEYLQSINWQSELLTMTTEEAWTYFRRITDTGSDRYIPKKRHKKGKSHPWVNREILRKIRRKRKCWRKFKNDHSAENFDAYKNAEKEVKKATQKAKRAHEKKLSQTRNLKPFFGYVNKKTKSRVTVGPLKENGKVLSEDRHMADALNNFFSSVFTIEDENDIPSLTDLNFSTTVSNMHFSSVQVVKKIDQLKCSNSAGTDTYSTRILKEIKHGVAEPLAIIFNKSLRSGDIPRDWKDSNITPIYKKGNKSECGNYRPVSLTSVPCKIMESLIKDKLVDHLQRNHLIKSSQHGFMKRKSCVTNLLEFLEEITSQVDKSSPMDIVYLDFSKAFDKVPKLRLIEKIRAHGIQGNALQWIENWLTDRRQRVFLNGELSDWKPVLSGVPQGSVLGPLAFVIYINDLDDMAPDVSIISKFADDTKLANTAATVEERTALQDNLNGLCKWADIWGMEYNIAKCKVMHVGNQNINHDYFMNNSKLEAVDYEKDVGVTVSKDLKPSIHCANAAMAANRMLGIISRAFHYRDKCVFLRLYKQYVRCHLEYCAPVWSPWSKHDEDMLENVQKRAIRMISGLQGSYEDKLKILNLESVAMRRKIIDLVQTFKIMKGFDDVNYKTWFSCTEDNIRNTRLSSYDKNIVTQRARLDMRKNFFSLRVAHSWNELPDLVKEAKNPKVFVKMLRAHYGLRDDR